MDFIKALVRQYWPNLLALAVFAAALIRYIHLARWEGRLELVAYAALGFLCVIASDEVAEWTGQYGFTRQQWWAYPAHYVRWRRCLDRCDHLALRAMSQSLWTPMPQSSRDRALEPAGRADADRRRLDPRRHAERPWRPRIRAMEQGASLLTGARPGGAGKTTLMAAILHLLPPGVRIGPVEGPQTTPNNGPLTPGPSPGAGEGRAAVLLLVHEIGDGHWYGYLWGKAVAQYVSLIGPGRRIASCLHADTLKSSPGSSRLSPSAWRAKPLAASG